MNRLIARAYERITGTPWTTTHRCAPWLLPANLYPELADYTDAELYARPTAEILAEIRARRAALSRQGARKELVR